MEVLLHSLIECWWV